MTMFRLSVASAAAAADQDDVPTIQLNETESTRFHALLDNPPPPNAALRLALARARERRYGSKTD